MGSSGKKKCKKCFTEYSKKLLFCPKCGTIDDRRAMQILSLDQKAKNHPEVAIRCKKCKSIFPNDQTKCPYCEIRVDQNNIESLSHFDKEKLKNTETPISKHYYSWKKLNAKKADTSIPMYQMVPCSACGKKLSIKAEVCPNCGNPTGVHVCPKCGGTNTKTISGTSKATSVLLWGPFAANKVISKFQCLDCRHKF